MKRLSPWTCFACDPDQSQRFRLFYNWPLVAALDDEEMNGTLVGAGDDEADAVGDPRANGAAAKAESDKS